MINLFTDGACSPNPGCGGWAACFYFCNESCEVYGYDLNTTNNVMEITAAIRGLQKIAEICPNEQNISIYSDSQYVINTMTKNWKRNTNIPLWNQLDILIKGKNINWIWVKGHADNVYNNIVDSLAVEARINKKSGFYISYNTPSDTTKLVNNTKSVSKTLDIDTTFTYNIFK